MTIHRELAVPVPGEARRAIESIVTGHVQDRGQVVLEAPDHAVTVALRAGTSLVVMGPRTRAVYHAAEPGPSWLKLRLNPEAAYGLLGAAGAELVDQVVPLAAVTGDRVARRLLSEGSLSLVAGLTAATSTDRTVLVRRATALLATGLRVAEVSRRLQIGERQLRSLFAATLGISPKQFARISRVRAVIDGAERRPLAQVAIDAGYYDQAHLTTEFKALMGVPPAAFTRGKMPTATACYTPS